MLFFFACGWSDHHLPTDWEPIRHKGSGGGARTLANDGNDGRSDVAPWMDCKSEGSSERELGEGVGCEVRHGFSGCDLSDFYICRTYVYEKYSCGVIEAVQWNHVSFYAWYGLYTMIYVCIHTMIVVGCLNCHWDILVYCWSEEIFQRSSIMWYG